MRLYRDIIYDKNANVFNSMLKCRNFKGVNFEWKFHCSNIIFIYLTFLGILYPPSSESTSWYLAAHGAIVAHLKVSFITWCRYLKNKKILIAHLDHVRYSIEQDISILIHHPNQIFFWFNRILRWPISLCSCIVKYQDVAWQGKNSALKF